MQPLPIDAFVPEALRLLRQSRVLVLTAPPGAGKTTRLPPAILAAGLLSGEHPRLVMLQPRRVAARAAARRIADEQGWTVGREVGWHIRFENRTTTATRLHVMTEGILTRRLQSDPYLEGAGAVLLDEFHERSLHTDLALARLKELRATVRADLLLVVMSATLIAEPVARYLGGAPILEVPGRPHPVAMRHTALDDGSHISVRVADAVRRAVRDTTCQGDVLVFLPGMGEIRRTADELAAFARTEDLLVLPLHGSLPEADQDRALRPADRRKIILSTNIAETSLTIEGVATVIDSGWARVLRHDPQRGLDRLDLSRISRASADQRAGRAGRTGPGTCVRLWSADQDRLLDAAEEPEVRRVDLAATVLTLHEWGYADASTFDWFEAPARDMLDGADRLLRMLGALDAKTGLPTPVGRRLLDLPVHPRLGRLLIAASDAGCPRAGAELAALLSERDLFDAGRGRDRAPTMTGQSDVLLRLDRFREAEAAGFPPGWGIDPAAGRNTARVRDDLLRLLPRSADRADDDTLLRLVLLAYPDRVVKRRAPASDRGLMVGGRGVVLDPSSLVREAELFVALDPQDERKGAQVEARVRIASAIRVEWLAELFPGSMVTQRGAEFDADRGAVVGVLREFYRDLPLRDVRTGSVDPDEAAAILAGELAQRADELLGAIPEIAAWRVRLEFLRKWMPDLNLPGFDVADLGEALAPACRGKRLLSEVCRASTLLPVLQGRLTFAQRQAMADQAPETIAVPTGNRIKLAWEPDRAPVLAVRLQEVFGQTQTPKVAGGRVSVVLHLLAPNFRPVQVTDDLPSFWANIYPRVRKDLRARYPKHSWPEDPLTAPPQAKGGRRR